MDGIMEKVTGIAITSVLILLFVLGVFKPFKANQKILSESNATMSSTLQVELQKAQN